MSVTAFVRIRNRTTRYGTAALAVACAVLVAGCGGQADEVSSIVRTTTNIAGAGVVGLDRDTAQACPLPSAPDQAGGTRSVTHAAGVSEVPADPKRIVVLSTSALDAACALGLWERVIGAATADGPRAQPLYLGYGVNKIPSVGVLGQPDPARIAELNPDLILGEVPSGAATFDALRAIAPTVLVGTSPSWQAQFTAFAAGMDRREAAASALDAYRGYAREVGTTIAANQSQASVLRFTPDVIRIQGADSFAGQVLADVGVQRPTAQRGPSVDITVDELATKAEGDIIYVDFVGEDGKHYGEKILRGDAWKDLGAASDHRVFAIEDSVWHGSGLTAARALVFDLQGSLNGYVTD
ncbi:ABC transporter substrate-binding protein [Nocardia bovistercoris]|uniref:ABC transporter substrate-binding protein n=1 Tax=Nocardia bovistercoris TaxID=2785916 RepID=A0A931N729_9NOCA|nr:ABC transporter substrate-binding protein [Nocardia bovistercoris]MBH0781624.1 ABC transporter substrate-binding protein [Nocardia bovistercoris]